MTISEETLMAYADGEADAPTRASVETAMRENPDIARRVERHRALRDTMQGAFAAVLEEPVPERLIAAARGRAPAPAGATTAGGVVDIAGARATASRKAAGGEARRWYPFALAASLLLGIGVGYFPRHGSGTLIEANPGGVVAGAALADALSTQLSDDRRAGLVAVTGLSFRDKAGSYCRTFSLRAAAASGLACRDGNGWTIKALAQAAPEPGENFRTAGSAMPAAIRAAVEESIEGEPLDRSAEIAARQARWAATPAH